MNLSYFIAKRISFSRTGGFSVTIHQIAVWSLALGVGVSILAFMVLGGFQKTVSDKVYGFTGHYQLERFTMSNTFEESPFEQDGDFLQQQKANPEIVHMQAYAHKAALIKGKDEVEGVIMKGVDKDFDSLNFRKYLVAGRFLNIPDQGSSNEIVISSYLANRLLLEVGDRIILYFVQDPPRYRRVKVVGIYETFLENFDEKLILGDLHTIRVLNGWEENQVGGVEIFVSTHPSQSLSRKLESLIGLDTKLIRSDEKYLEIFDWLKLLDTNVYVFVGLIAFVAVFNMAAILFILIMERTQMIGLLKALGSTDRQVRQVFFWNGMRIVGKGLLIGNGIGLGIGALQFFFHLIPLDPQSYYMSFVPIDWNWPVFLLINVSISLLTALVLWIPVMVISRVDPIQSMRFD